MIWNIGDFMGMPIEEILIYILSLVLGAFVAISFHEWAHAFVAYKLGDPTAKNMGRMSLDPTKHMDPVGLIAFILVGVGWAKPVIVNSRNLKHFRRDDVFISIAGPLMNLLLSFIFFGLFFFGVRFWGWGQGGALQQALLQICWAVCSLNISFAIFNILPIPPLDGFHVMTSLFVRKSYKVIEILKRYGHIILIVLLVSRIIPTVMDWAFYGLTDLYISFFELFI